MDAPPVILAYIEKGGWLWAYRLIGAFSLASVIAVHLLIVALGLPFYEVPRGSLIRPMDYGFNILMWAICTLAFVPIAVVTIFFRRWSIWAWLVLALALTPFPLAKAILRDAQERQGFLLAE